VYHEQESDIVSRREVHDVYKRNLRHENMYIKATYRLEYMGAHMTKRVGVHDISYPINDPELHEQVYDVWLGIVP
jgi:hypothetical protein